MRSSLNLSKINRSFDGLRDSIKGASDISESISTNLDESIKVDRQRISMSSKMFARKRDLLRRRSKEELLEASGISGSIRNTGRVIRKTTRGFLGRILDFVGKVLIGWLFLNLPKIIKLSQDLVKRMKGYFDILTGFTQNVVLFFTRFQNNLKEIGEKLRAIDFDTSLKQVTDFMRRVRDSFTRITLGTIKAINKFVGSTEDEMARQIGPEFYEMYKRLSGKPTDEGEDNQEETDTEGGEDDGEDLERISNEKLIENGIQNLKDKQGGKLTESQKSIVDSNNLMDIHEMLESNGFQIYIDEDTGGMAYFDQAFIAQFEKMFNEGNVRPLTLNEIPYRDKSEDDGISYDKIKENIENNAIIESINKNVFRDQLQLPDSIDNIDIDVPLDALKNFFRQNIMREENLNTDGGINNNNKIIKDQAKQKVDGP
jgi:hypothetical protein